MPLLGVANKMFTPLGGGIKLDGSIASLAAVSAKEIYATGVTTNGNYWVKGTGSTPRLVYCLMDRRGGGWTRVMRIQREYNSAGNNFYNFNIGSSFDSSINTTFNLAPSLFGNGTGSDLSIMYRVVGSGGAAGSSFPGAQAGAIWRGYALTDAWNTAKDSGALATDGDPEYSTDGVTFTNYTNSYELFKANASWNFSHAHGQSGPGFYNSGDLTAGFILHGTTTSDSFGAVYTYIDGHANVGNEQTWSYVDVYIRKDR
jgi:hypothetical protein